MRQHSRGALRPSFAVVSAPIKTMIEELFLYAQRPLSHAAGVPGTQLPEAHVGAG